MGHNYEVSVVFHITAVDEDDAVAQVRDQLNAQNVGGWAILDEAAEYVGEAIYARLTVDGTAAAETAACARHLSDSQPSDDTVTEPVDCSGNELLECQTCGAVAV